ncbi:uncharacterized protein CLUP02_16078 [Colletotrichum lupini]|uniref:Uncharacterized protein n=1 Tax=Colletotrichum lupini TaxID=145971 RepID=A0A9Q8WNV8_9PEZI|nr:uncharacterized protein CLUP02_16078 [Colletotrichum lupini]UQC90548.1 hypothetical protein CLUP02_16078 [Colletotrichum lupini]
MPRSKTGPRAQDQIFFNGDDVQGLVTTVARTANDHAKGPILWALLPISYFEPGLQLTYTWMSNLPIDRSQVQMCADVPFTSGLVEEQPGRHLGRWVRARKRVLYLHHHPSGEVFRSPGNQSPGCVAFGQRSRYAVPASSSSFDWLSFQRAEMVMVSAPWFLLWRVRKRGNNRALLKGVGSSTRTIEPFPAGLVAIVELINTIHLDEHGSPAISMSWAPGLQYLSVLPPRQATRHLAKALRPTEASLYLSQVQSHSVGERENVGMHDHLNSTSPGSLSESQTMPVGSQPDEIQDMRALRDQISPAGRQGSTLKYVEYHEYHQSGVLRRMKAHLGLRSLQDGRRARGGAMPAVSVTSTSFTNHLPSIMTSSAAYGGHMTQRRTIDSCQDYKLSSSKHPLFTGIISGKQLAVKNCSLGRENTNVPTWPARPRQPAFAIATTQVAPCKIITPATIRSLGHIMRGRTVPFRCSIDYGTIDVSTRSFIRLGAYLDQRKDEELSPSPTYRRFDNIDCSSLRNSMEWPTAFIGFRICQMAHGLLRDGQLRTPTLHFMRIRPLFNATSYDRGASLISALRLLRSARLVRSLQRPSDIDVLPTQPATQAIRLATPREYTLASGTRDDAKVRTEVKLILWPVRLPNQSVVRRAKRGPYRGLGRFDSFRVVTLYLKLICCLSDPSYQHRHPRCLDQSFPQQQTTIWECCVTYSLNIRHQAHLDSRKSLHNKYGVRVEDFAASVALGTTARTPGEWDLVWIWAPTSLPKRITFQSPKSFVILVSAAEAWPLRVTRMALCEVEGRYTQIDGGSAPFGKRMEAV